MGLLRRVDDQILKDIGVSAAGDRLRTRNAIAKLASAPVAEVSLSSTAPPHQTTATPAERRQLAVTFCDLVGSTALSTSIISFRVVESIRSRERIGHLAGYACRVRLTGRALDRPRPAPVRQLAIIIRAKHRLAAFANDRILLASK